MKQLLSLSVVNCTVYEFSCKIRSSCGELGLYQDYPRSFDVLIPLSTSGFRIGKFKFSVLSKVFASSRIFRFAKIFTVRFPSPNFCELPDFQVCVSSSFIRPKYFRVITSGECGHGFSSRQTFFLLLQILLCYSFQNFFIYLLRMCFIGLYFLELLRHFLNLRRSFDDILVSIWTVLVIGRI